MLRRPGRAVVRECFVEIVWFVLRPSMKHGEPFAAILQVATVGSWLPLLRCQRKKERIRPWVVD